MGASNDFFLTLGAAIVCFIFTNIDELVLLVIFVSQAQMKPEDQAQKEKDNEKDKEKEKALVKPLTMAHIWLGTFLGFTLIVAISLIGLVAGEFVPPLYIGLGGFLPILLGLWSLFKQIKECIYGEDDEEEDDEKKDGEDSKEKDKDTQGDRDREKDRDRDKEKTESKEPSKEKDARNLDGPKSSQSERESPTITPTSPKSDRITFSDPASYTKPLPASGSGARPSPLATPLPPRPGTPALNTNYDRPLPSRGPATRAVSEIHVVSPAQMQTLTLALDAQRTGQPQTQHTQAGVPYVPPDVRRSMSDWSLGQHHTHHHGRVTRSGTIAKINHSMALGDDFAVAVARKQSDRNIGVKVKAKPRMEAISEEDEKKAAEESKMRPVSGENANLGAGFGLSAHTPAHAGTPANANTNTLTIALAGADGSGPESLRSSVSNVGVSPSDDDKSWKAKIAACLALMFHPQVLKVIIVTVANSGDNVGVYLPIFAAASSGGLVEILITFYVFMVLFVLFSIAIMRCKAIADGAEKYGQIIYPWPLIGIGLYILSDSIVFHPHG